LAPHAALRPRRVACVACAARRLPAGDDERLVVAAPPLEEVARVALGPPGRARGRRGLACDVRGRGEGDPRARLLPAARRLSQRRRRAAGGRPPRGAGGVDARPAGGGVAARRAVLLALP